MHRVPAIPFPTTTNFCLFILKPPQSYKRIIVNLYGINSIVSQNCYKKIIHVTFSPIENNLGSFDCMGKAGL